MKELSFDQLGVFQCLPSQRLRVSKFIETVVLWGCVTHCKQSHETVMVEAEKHRICDARSIDKHLRTQ